MQWGYFLFSFSLSNSHLSWPLGWQRATWLYYFSFVIQTLVFCCICDLGSDLGRKKKRNKTTHSLICGMWLCLSVKWEEGIESISLYEGRTTAFPVCWWGRRTYRNSQVPQHIEETIYFFLSIFRIKFFLVLILDLTLIPLTSKITEIIHCWALLQTSLLILMQEGKMQPRRAMGHAKKAKLLVFHSESTRMQQ